MITDETSPGDFRNDRQGDYSHIKGWGIDADPENDPTYPIKNRTDEEQRGYSWERPVQQQSDVEILKSVERPNRTAVFGTVSPPSGLSGMIRRYAYKYSESSYGRWLPLVLADRIGVYEGILEDFSRGIVPNIIKERGWNAQWKYDRKAFVTKIAVATAVTAVAIGILMSQKSKKRKLHY